MSANITYFVFRTPDGGFAEALYECINSANTKLWKSDSLDISYYEGQASSLAIDPLPCSALSFAEFLSRRFGDSHMIARIINDSYWNYTLFHCGQEVDHFSTVPDFDAIWGVPMNYLSRSSDLHAEILSQRWRIDPKVFAKYLKPWSYSIINDTVYYNQHNKAFENDEFPYGNAYQIYDFLKAIGADFPQRSVV